MAFLSAKMWNFGRQNIFATDVGAADLPTTNTSGVIQVGDQVVNLSGSVGQPVGWICTAQSATSVTWVSTSSLGGSNQLRSSASSTTLLSSDKYLFMTAAGTVTLPTPSTSFNKAFTIKASGAAAQPITLTSATAALDGVATGSQTLSANEAADIFSDGTNWFTVGRDGYQQTITAVPPYTLSTSDKYVISPAGLLTLPAASLAQIGYEYVIHATASSVTITPASGNYNGAAAGTLAANATARVFSNGTNYFTAN